MKTITLVTPHYAPETNAAAKRLTAAAEFLAGRGWRVTVVTLLPHHPQNRLYDGYDRPTPHGETVGGVRIVRYRPVIVPKANFVLRLLAETLFCWHAFLYLARQPAEVVLVSSPYMFLGPAAIAAARLREKKVVWDVRDLTWLYPRSAGKRTFGSDKLLARFMKWVAARVDGLTTATEGLLEYFEARPNLSLCVPNGVSRALLDAFAPLLPEPDAPLEPRVLYAGLFGFNHKLLTVLEAAQAAPELSFTLAGDGPDFGALEAYVRTNALTNVRFTGYLDAERLQQLYAAHDILVSHVRGDPIHRWAQPAKLWEYMATGRPVVHAGEGEAVALIEAHGLALALPPENGAALAATLRAVLSNPREARRMGLRGRAFVAEHRERERILAGLETFLSTVLAARG